MSVARLRLIRGMLCLNVLQSSSCSSPQMAAEALVSGEVVAVPTDTIYGIAALVQVKRLGRFIYW